ncbi:putative gustatory receptor 28a [Diachasma alloeum]|uniref:Gustatory receptor n=1 Tax=Diachasma alloeum TaxID=454923 RepID=A0A4E0S4L5_9HYME|nr:putative gustatory receptor 28a [Diachasma alloeum]THK33243.1 gustatory receptor 27 [Diachasma alloeum]
MRFIMFHIVEAISCILGLAPCRINITPQSAKKIDYSFTLSFSQLRCAYNILLTIFFSTIIILAVPHMTEVSYPNNSKTVMVIVIALAISGNLFAIMIIIFYSIFQRHIINIGNRLSEFDRKYGHKLFGMRSSGIGDLQKFITIILMILVWIGLLTTSLVVPPQLFLITSALCTAFLSWILIQYSLIINILRDRFEGLNNAFLAISKCPIAFEENSIFSGYTMNVRLTIENFIMIRRARNMLYEISRQVSKFFSFPVLVVVSHCCCSCVDSIYFLIMTLVPFKFNGFSMISVNSVFWILMCAYPITVLSASVNTFHAETDRTADIIYGIMEIYACNKNIQSELNNFAIELLHTRVQFTACGVFSLDCSLLHSIFGMIVTYLLILLQFKPTDG